MENGRPPIEDFSESKEESEVVPGFFASFIERLKKNSEADKDDTEDDAEAGKNKKSKLSQSFLKRFFGRIVTKENIPGETVNSSPRKSVNSEEKTDHLPPPDSLAETATGHPSGAPIIETKTSDSGRHELPDVPSGNSPDRHSDHDLGQADLRAVEPGPSQEAEVDSNNRENIINNGDEAPAAFYNESRGGHIANARPRDVETGITFYDKKSDPESSRRGVAVLTALLGAEYFARRRADRKVRQELKQVQKRTKSLEKRIPSGAETSKVTRESRGSKDVLPHDLKTKLEQTESFKRQPIIEKGRVAKKEIVVDNRNRLHLMSAETPVAEPKEPMKERRQERIQPDDLPIMEPLDPLVRLELDNYKDRKAEEFERVILERVADAAEHDVPIEKHYERRHEVKDASTKVTSNAASVSSIISQMGAQSTSSFPAILPHQQSSPSAKSMPQHNSNHAIDNVAYKQAMKSGFWAAIVILLLILILGLLSN